MEEIQEKNSISIDEANQYLLIEFPTATIPRFYGLFIF